MDTGKARPRRSGDKRVLLILLAAGLCLCACTSFHEAVHTLEGLQKEPSEPDLVKEVDPIHEGYLVFTDRLNGKEVKKPEEEALDALEVIRDHGFDTNEERIDTLPLLCKTAGRSPAALVRAASFRTLDRVVGASLSRFRPPMLSARAEEYDARVRRLRALSAEGSSQEERNFVEPLLVYFTKVSAQRAALALSALEALRLLDDLEKAENTSDERLERTRLEVTLQAVLLTTLEGLRDRDRTVRLEAVNLLFRFPWETVRLPLAENLEWNPYLLEPAMRTRILRRLKAAADRPETVGLKVLKQVARGLDFADPAVLWRTVDLFRALTGLQESDPEFWRDWWKEYLLQHAGDQG